MITTIGLAILSFFISMAIGFFILVLFGKDWFTGINLIFLIYYIPVILIGSGIFFTLPIYLLLKKSPFIINRSGKIIAFLIILIVLLFGLFILPR